MRRFSGCRPSSSSTAPSAADGNGRTVAEILRRRGHVVFTPTLTGVGERVHLGPRAGLNANILDVVALLDFEDLRDVMLCGAGYGGMAVTGAADRVAGRLALLVHIDALIPTDGQFGLDLLPAEFGDVLRAAADRSGHGWVDVPTAVLPPGGAVAEHARRRYIARLRPQPVATFT